MVDQASAEISSHSGQPFTFHLIVAGLPPYYCASDSFYCACLPPTILVFVPMPTDEALWNADKDEEAEEEDLDVMIEVLIRDEVRHIYSIHPNHTMYMADTLDTPPPQKLH